MHYRSFLPGLGALSLIALTAAAQSAGISQPESGSVAAPADIVLTVSDAVPDNRDSAEKGESPYAQAEALLKRLLAQREATLGKEHTQTLTTLTSLASVYKAQGRYREAEVLYKRALEASKRTLGDEHSFTQATARGLASAYQAEGRYDEAELVLRLGQSANQ